MYATKQLFRWGGQVWQRINTPVAMERKLRMVAAMRCSGWMRICDGRDGCGHAVLGVVAAMRWSGWRRTCSGRSVGVSDWRRYYVTHDRCASPSQGQERAWWPPVHSLKAQNTEPYACLLRLGLGGEAGKGGAARGERAPGKQFKRCTVLCIDKGGKRVWLRACVCQYGTHAHRSRCPSTRSAMKQAHANPKARIPPPAHASSCLSS